MTTPRPYLLVSLTAMTIMTLGLGACAGGSARTATEEPSPVAAAPSALRFDNQATSHVDVYLVGDKREWLLGRVEPGATAALRIPDGSLQSNPGFVRLAVIAGGQMTQQAARDVRAQLTIAQPASMMLSQRWRLSQGQLTSTALRGTSTASRHD